MTTAGLFPLRRTKARQKLGKLVKGKNNSVFKGTDYIEA